VGGRTAARLADADADAGDGEVRKGAGQAGERRHGAPHEDGEGDDGTPIAAIGPAGDRDAHHGVEGGEGDPGEEAQVGVRDLELALDRLEQDGEDRAVDEVEDVDDEQDSERIARGPARHRRRGGHRLRRERPGGTRLGHRRMIPPGACRRRKRPSGALQASEVEPLRRSTAVARRVRLRSPS
jgi:hypothetical protein